MFLNGEIQKTHHGKLQSLSLGSRSIENRYTARCRSISGGFFTLPRRARRAVLRDMFT